MANLSSKTGTITTPVQTQISLANNATTSVQDMSAYDAQEVMGFVYVDATADLRAYFTVTVVKNGAGTYEIAGADVAGDQSGTGASAIAPVSFSMSGSILQATLPNISGFVSAYLRYQLSAPYLGGNYPLTVSARQVAGDVSGVAVPAGYIGEKLDFTTRGVTCTNAGAWYANTSPLTTLTPGIWLVHGYYSPAIPTATADVAYAMISTNNSNDGTGNISISSTGTYSVAATSISNNSVAAMIAGYVIATGNTPIYAKAFNEDRAGLVTQVIGFAIRIA